MSTLARRVLEAVAPLVTGPVYGLPGVHNLPFWRESGDDLPPIVVPRHDQTAGYAADGSARATGSLGVALTTSGPGAANALAAFGEAAASHSAVLLVASEVATGLTGRRVLHAMPAGVPAQAELFRPLAKATFAPRTVDEARAAVGEAVAAALTPPRGPVYLGLPTDLLSVPAPPAEVRLPPAPVPPAEDVAAAARLLAAADRVVLWAGGGAAGAGDAVLRLARCLRAPVVTTFAGTGVVPPDDPLAVRLPPHEPETAALLAAADLLLVAGSDLDGMTTRNWTMPRPPRLVRVDANPTPPVDGWAADVALRGDTAAVLDALAAALGAAGEPGHRSAPNLEAIAAGRRRLAGDPASAEAMRLVGAVEAAVDAAGCAVVCDMAVAGYWVAGYAALPRPRRLLYPMGWGTLGFGLPTAVGVAAAVGATLVVTGDAGALYGIGELATFAQERLPVTVLVVDDEGYGMLRFEQDRTGAPRRGVDLTSPDFVALADAFGVPAVRVTGIGPELEKALVSAVTAGGPRLVTVRAGLTPPRTTSPRWRDPA